MSATNPDVHCIVHDQSSTCTFIVSDPATKECAVIDSVMDYNQASGRYHYEHCDKILAYIAEQKLSPKYLLETHVHADHLTGSDYLLSKMNTTEKKVTNCIGQNISQVQTIFAKMFNMDIPVNGSQFDTLIKDNDEMKLGNFTIKSMWTPGHTPVCTSFLIGASVFVGDTLFMPDIGTARCDFPGGSIEDLFESCTRLLALPIDTDMYVGHDYPGTRREFRWKTSVKEQKESNKMMKDGISKTEYLALRAIRDSGLNVPQLLLPSLQVNIRAGKFPEAENNGVSYIKIPAVFIDVAADKATRLEKKTNAEKSLADYHDHTPAANK